MRRRRAFPCHAARRRTEEQTITDLTCDVAVIGAGTAGLAAERSARAAGATTLLIDDCFVGTTCASVGCMPSKLLIAAAAAAYDVARAGVFGIVVADHHIDGPAVLKRVRSERDAFVAATCKGIAALPEGVRVQARATFEGTTTLRLDDGRHVTAKAVVIATGSHPQMPEVFAPLGDLVLTNETVFDLDDLPRSLAVVGAGPLGLELAQAMARLGVETMVFDTGETIGGLDDSHVAEAYHAILSREMPILLAVELEAKLDGGDGADGVMLSWSGSASGERRFEYLIVATRRPPRIKDIGLETTGLALDDHGMPD